MQGTLGGSLRPCTSLLHTHRTSLLPLVNFGQRSLVTCSVFGRENRDGSDLRKGKTEPRVWSRRDAASTLGLGVRRHLVVVAAKRSLLSELQSIKEEADAAGPLEFESPLDVVLYPDPRLRAKNKLIKVFDEKLQQLVNEMFDIMYKTDGVGLAAPQVGVNVRLMVYNPLGERGSGEEYVLVNPRIVKYGKTRDLFDEGCLSFPILERGPKQAPTSNSSFISVSGGHFQLDGNLWRFYGTNAYWLQMSTDDDIDLTFHTIATAGFRVVRTWAFNDVSSKPSSGTYFQILQNGHATINTGVDGLQRLDKVVAAASKYGVKLLLTLTNNWNPARAMQSTSWDRRDNGGELPRGFLSNDYGGMDLYVQNFHPGGTHDLFYTDSTIISAFKNYVAQVIKRYANNPTVLGWELGNDLRCSSTFPASSSCNTQTITKWVVEISSYIKTLDSNHLVTAGDGGFYCLGCPKLYAKQQATQPSPSLPGHSFDGSYGVDTEDILASPCVDFGSFQLFPDQVDYFPETNPSFAVKAIGDGGKWTEVHSNTAIQFGKPEVLTAMAIITKRDWKFFVPFNATAPFPDNVPCRGVEDFQHTYAFTSWSGTSLNGDVDGVLEYLWVQRGLTSHGTTHKRQLTNSPGPSYYNGAASGQSALQFINSLPHAPPPS